MPLILAIEPDRRQAAELTSVIQQRVGAEVILADTTERALDAIGDRVPDLVLVPALLSPQDDAALATALRVIAAAAHVQTLTIPVLASTPTRSVREPLLAKWRSGRTASRVPAGCDPVVFAEQMTAYLKEAAAERAKLDEAFDPSTDDENSDQKRVEPIDRPPDSPPLLAALACEEPMTALDATINADESVEPDAIDSASELSEIELWMPLSAGTGPLWPHLEGVVTEPRPEFPVVVAQPDVAQVFDEPEEPELVVPPDAPPVVVLPERAEWVELIESLRHDLERLRTEQLDAAPALVSTRPQAAAVPLPPETAYKPRRRSRKPQTVRDEWGYFDPEQCGFAALLAKLEEITDAADGQEAVPPA